MSRGAPLSRETPQTRTLRVGSAGIHGRWIILALNVTDTLPATATHTRVTLLRRRSGYVLKLDPVELPVPV